MIIGITGGTGCGKTTLLKLLADRGYTVLDCDAIYHQLLKTDKKLLSAIESRFPGTVICGELHRKELGKIVFADPAALQDLNKITHGAVKAEVLQLMTENTAIDAIGLFEGGLAALCDLTVAVTAPDALRVARLVARDGVSEEYALSRIRAQKAQEEFISLCDYSLHNDGTEAAFQEKCLAFFREQGIIKP